MPITVSLNLDGCTVAELQTFVRALESSGAQPVSVLKVEDNHLVATITQSHGQAAHFNSPSKNETIIDGQAIGNVALNSIIDALISKRGE
ncbi:Uncharacterised protein [Corynebacterium kutscheri]|uniref:Uncharacterized protein n=1 Tax=Corynebacterium kutscheri TaxID=35755 RepID=A0A0F6QZ75_9CORY|nr:hypothetical protein [Corynebacterium kutscheri]AKE40982.1 hypothetical protein UL82_03885 [Corynebacterium kutscheri]VEH06849.1 Uncharacterised protein [Corynebacterium kutscheri]VEH09280.1 Uncharacterised protein [Corynebacterium kutscheri]VEH79368.1 Uncharacterised protein [Corynebacterium kutscheri]